MGVGGAEGEGEEKIDRHVEDQRMVNGDGEGEGETVHLNGDASQGMVDETGTGRNSATTTTATGRHAAWTDGTFQTGTISGGAVTMDSAQSRQGGTLTDEELRRRLEERMRADLENDDGDDGGMHL